MCPSAHAVAASLYAEPLLTVFATKHIHLQTSYILAFTSKMQSGRSSCVSLLFDTLLNSAATRQSFKEQEALVYQQLAQLIKDAVWLKSYLAAVMRLEQEAFVTAHNALGNAKASPMMHPQLEPVHLPTTPVEGGMIPAARPMDSPGQVPHYRLPAFSHC